jgi:hypothetical protein
MLAHKDWSIQNLRMVLRTFNWAATGDFSLGFADEDVAAKLFSLETPSWLGFEETAVWPGSRYSRYSCLREI